MRVNAQQAIQHAQKLLAQGHFREAGEITRQLYRARPNGPMIALLHGETMLRAGRIRDARPPLETAAAGLPPAHVGAALAMLGDCRSALGDETGAVEALNRAIKINAGDIQAASTMANTLIDMGRLEDAEASIRPYLDQRPMPATLASTYARLCKRRKQPEAAIERLERAAAEPGASAGIHSALGQCLEAVGRYDAAFDAFEQANRAMGARLDRTMNTQQSQAALEGLLHTELPSVSEAAPPRVVLIVGMPRSGTSLTEQIFASHPQVGACGESQSLPALARRVCKDRARPITPSVDGPTLLREGAAYVADLCAEASRVEPAVVTDKNPMNLFLLSVAARAIPGLRVIRCRRSAMDVCVSCFTSPLGPDHSYACDLDDCATFYAGAERVLDAAAEKLGDAMLDVTYETLVRDPEPTVRAMLDHAGLPFDERCLSPERTGRVVQTISRDQVTSAISDKSVGRWKRYADRVSPLREALVREGVMLPE